MNRELPATTAERLERVADIIEFEDGAWDQTYWVRDADRRGPAGPEQIVGGADSALACGTCCCVAGWAVALSPADVIAAKVSDPFLRWHMSGARALGLTDDAAAYLFSASNGNWPMPDVLRRLAKCDEPRDLNDVIDARDAAEGNEG